MLDCWFPLKTKPVVRPFSYIPISVVLMGLSISPIRLSFVSYIHRKRLGIKENMPITVTVLGIKCLYTETVLGIFFRTTMDGIRHKILVGRIIYLLLNRF